jgi:hypothetical protein
LKKRRAIAGILPDDPMSPAPSVITTRRDMLAGGVHVAFREVK